MEGVSCGANGLQGRTLAAASNPPLGSLWMGKQKTKQNKIKYCDCAGKKKRENKHRLASQLQSLAGPTLSSCCLENLSPSLQEPSLQIPDRIPKFGLSERESCGTTK